MAVPINYDLLPAIHQRMIVERNVSAEDIERWEMLQETFSCQFPPPWAYDYGGGVLKETPPLYNQPGYVPNPITEDDMEELRLLFPYKP